MATDFLAAVTQLCNEKGISKDVVISAIEAALVSAYKRNYGTAQNITARIDPETGDARIYAQKRVVDEVTDPRGEISIDEARRARPDVQVGDLIDVETTPANFGRIAAQTAKQVITQRLREAEREVVFAEFTDREGDVVPATVQRIEQRGDQRIITVEIAQLPQRVEAVLPQSEQVPTEHYYVGQRLSVYVMEVHKNPKGPQIVVSRTHRNLVRRLFEREIPEIKAGTVEIKSIAREPGSRSKVAVAARQEGLDPVGSCVGQRGVRIQNILNELGGEKIDVVQWSADPIQFVANSLAPAQILKVELDPEEHTAYVVVDDKQLSLAIGKEGQNARLAAKLTGWRIDIKSASVAAHEPLVKRKKPILTTGGEEESLLAVRLQEALKGTGLVEATLTPSGAPPANGVVSEPAKRKGKKGAANSETPA
jgi:N utilization substance protein A